MEGWEGHVEVSDGEVEEGFGGRGGRGSLDVGSEIGGRVDDTDCQRESDTERGSTYQGSREDGAILAQAMLQSANTA
jgi:hypothetical protein